MSRRHRVRPVVGSRVARTMGCRGTGTVVPPFDWRTSTDGTYKAPTAEEIPVRWDDKTTGYISHFSVEVTR